MVVTDRFHCILVFLKTVLFYLLGACNWDIHPYIFERLLLLQRPCYFSLSCYGHVLHRFSMESSPEMNCVIYWIIHDVSLPWIVYYCLFMTGNYPLKIYTSPDNKVHGADMGPIWGRQDPDGPHGSPMNFAIWVKITIIGILDFLIYCHWRIIDKREYRMWIEFCRK